jgi:hypothetical protein
MEAELRKREICKEQGQYWIGQVKWRDQVKEIEKSIPVDHAKMWTLDPP